MTRQASVPSEGPFGVHALACFRPSSLKAGHRAINFQTRSEKQPDQNHRNQTKQTHMTNSKTTNIQAPTRPPTGMMLRCLLLPLCALPLLAEAQVPLIRSGVGADAAAIQATVNQF